MNKYKLYDDVMVTDEGYIRFLITSENLDRVCRYMDTLSLKGDFTKIALFYNPPPMPDKHVGVMECPESEYEGIKWENLK